MMGDFLSRVLLLAFGYAYPAYECYKTVELNKPEIEKLIFWCQYWILVALLTVLERFGDFAISWLPLYSEAKLMFFIYLWCPRTKGTSYVYETFFRPYISQYENDIDCSILDLRVRAGDMLVVYWQKVAIIGQTTFFNILKYASAQSPAHSSRSRSTQEIQTPETKICPRNRVDYLPSYINNKIICSTQDLGGISVDHSSAVIYLFLFITLPYQQSYPQKQQQAQPQQPKQSLPQQQQKQSLPQQQQQQMPHEKPTTLRRAASAAARTAGIMQQSEDTKIAYSNPKTRRLLPTKSAPTASTRSTVAATKPVEDLKSSGMKLATEEAPSPSSNAAMPGSEPSAPPLPKSAEDDMSIDEVDIPIEDMDEPVATPEETPMEEAIRVTRGRLRKRIAAVSTADGGAAN
uniref:Magnaporthe grisea pathogenicity protein n=1 Tax=Oryza sativa subsp. japonica TaxID=39947 RepID=Q8SAU2_ORYSJ|nr:Putative Magnaporthe grisea pathogenicity protein [Oryza sativa]